MDKVCEYSGLIFAGNISVLLFVAVTTDYWEYRGLNNTDAVATLLTLLTGSDPGAPLVITPSTSIIMRYSSHTKRWALLDVHDLEITVPNQTFIHVNTALYRNRQTEECGSPKYATDSNFNMQDNTVENATCASVATEDTIILYQQYGNLFRDCDNIGSK